MVDYISGIPILTMIKSVDQPHSPLSVIVRIAR
jgi:hypothetical protein